MPQKFKLAPKGFTIIEVMIVLAMAGAIISVILLVVPSAQRTSRNTSRKADVHSLITALKEYQNNHRGQFPHNPSPTGPGSDTQFFNQDILIDRNAKLVYYPVDYSGPKKKQNIRYDYFGNPSYVDASWIHMHTSRVDDPEHVFIYTAVGCDPTTKEAMTEISPGKPFPHNTFSIFYWLETATGKSQQCIQVD